MIFKGRQNQFWLAWVWDWDMPWVLKTNFMHDRFNQAWPGQRNSTPQTLSELSANQHWLCTLKRPLCEAQHNHDKSTTFKTPDWDQSRAEWPFNSLLTYLFHGFTDTTTASIIVEETGRIPMRICKLLTDLPRYSRRGSQQGLDSKPMHL